MTDEELDALEKATRLAAADMLYLPPHLTQQVSTAITTLRECEARLRAQLSEATKLAAAGNLIALELRVTEGLVEEQRARAERAEAALATMFGDGLRTAISVIASIGYGKNEDVDAGHEEALRAVEKYLTDWMSRSQPHDRTALDRHDAKTREKALQEAFYSLFKHRSSIHTNNGETFVAVKLADAAEGIIALIEKSDAR